MNITRYNYEEYFILYMDNELDSNDRRQVEAFVQKNPDLKEELDLHLQYKLVPDTTIIFDGKEELMKVNGETPVSLTNYKEWLLLYLDNELTTAQKTTIEEFISSHPFVKEELALLQRARLQPEKIIFSGKASLYRREEKVKRLPVRWWRVAAAAVLLLGLGITTAVVMNNRSDNETGKIVKRTPGEKLPPVISPVVNNKKDSTVSVDNINQSYTPDPSQTATARVPLQEKNNVVAKQLPVTIPLMQEKKAETLVTTRHPPSNDLPQPVHNRNIGKVDVSNPIAAIQKEIIPQQDPLTNSVVTTKDPPSSESIRTASQVDTDMDQSSKKSKLRGFFRKVARTFEKRTDIDPTDDDNKLLVAGLSFKLK